ncbi:MAG: hypothetical protein PVG39_14595 [Desulfobacteraceae bacterium]|jgi:hypothetical protein
MSLKRKSFELDPEETSRSEAKEQRRKHEKERRAAVRLLVNYVKDFGELEDENVKKAVELLDRRKGRYQGETRLEQFIALFDNKKEVHEDDVFSAMKEGRSVMMGLIKKAEKLDFVFEFDPERKMYVLLSKGRKA